MQSRVKGIEQRGVAILCGVAREGLAYQRTLEQRDLKEGCIAEPCRSAVRLGL